MRTESLAVKVRKMESAKGDGFDLIEALEAGRRMAAGAGRRDLLSRMVESLPAGPEWDRIREARRRMLEGGLRDEC